MNEDDYANRLKLFKTGHNDRHHYFEIVDEDGTPKSSRTPPQWHPIRRGYIELNISSLSLNTQYSQIPGANLRTGEADIESSEFKRLSGFGLISDSTIATEPPTISSFVSGFKHSGIAVDIRYSKKDDGIFFYTGVSTSNTPRECSSCYRSIFIKKFWI